MTELTILFLWHMHQPFYKNLSIGIYLLPWVLLHGTKDYLDMPLLVEAFPRIKQNFNLVPSLIVQLLDYEKGLDNDLYVSLFRKEAETLTQKEKVFLLRNFFNSNWENMIAPYPRYYELLKKRGFYYPKEELDKIAQDFSEDEFRDLQILFFLSWIDPMFFDEMEELKYLREKGRYYSEEDKKILETVQREIIKRILPTYRRLSEEGKIELSTSPFYHPIIPLLIDTDIARESSPSIFLPDERFNHPEDAIMQVKRAKDFFYEIFGFYPSGMWPPEGSVSDEALKIYASEGVKWLATDEDILFLSLNFNLSRGIWGKEVYPDFLYKPYVFDTGGLRITVLFRDRILSDLISFHYSRMDPKEAVKDLMRRLKEIGKAVEGKIRDPMVLIAMDGENAWEFYKNDGRDFLNYLYESLSKDKFIRSETISQYLRRAQDYDYLNHIHPGSWINHNFNVWIGHVEDNTAWSLLKVTRDFLEREDPERKNDKAWESLYIAEGSDWNWWYGEDHASENDEIFDSLFRENLMNVYRFLGKEPPEDLTLPILVEEREVKPKEEPTSFINPIIDGKVTNYFEWIGSGYFRSSGSGVAMHEAGLIRSVNFGFNRNSFFLRVDVERDFLKSREDFSFEISIQGEKKYLISYFPKSGRIDSEIPISLAFSDILELEVPREKIDLTGKILMSVAIKIDGVMYDRLPKKGLLSISVPGETFEAEMWYI